MSQTSAAGGAHPIHGPQVGLLLHLGIVTLATDLADQKPGFEDLVIAHERLHLRVPNHGRLFKALMTGHVSAWKIYDLKRRHEHTNAIRCRSC